MASVWRLQQHLLLSHSPRSSLERWQRVKNRRNGFIQFYNHIAALLCRRDSFQFPVTAAKSEDCSSLLSQQRGSYRWSALAYVNISHLDKALGSVFTWGSSPFWNMKGPRELERWAMERMNHSTTKYHLSLDTFYTWTRYNNSIQQFSGLPWCHCVKASIDIVSKNVTHDCCWRACPQTTSRNDLFSVFCVFVIIFVSLFLFKHQCCIVRIKALFYSWLIHLQWNNILVILTSGFLLHSHITDLFL